MLCAVSLPRPLECKPLVWIFSSYTSYTSNAGRLVVFSRCRFRLQGQIRLKQIMSLSLTAHQPQIGRQQATPINKYLKASARPPQDCLISSQECTIFVLRLKLTMLADCGEATAVLSLLCCACSRLLPVSASSRERTNEAVWRRSPQDHKSKFRCRSRAAPAGYRTAVQVL